MTSDRHKFRRQEEFAILYLSFGITRPVRHQPCDLKEVLAKYLFYIVAKHDHLLQT